MSDLNSFDDADGEYPVVDDDKPFVFSTKWCLDCAMVTGRYSSGLVREFDAHIENGTGNPFPIFAELGALEGAQGARTSRTRPACRFGGRWLKGLWHKHHIQSGFQSIAVNLARHWKPERLQQALLGSFGGQTFADAEQMVRAFSQCIVHDGYLERGAGNKLTGEWIVFAKQDGVSYYLTLAIHTESYEAIWRRCKASAAEFPDLRIIQEDR